MHTLVCCQNTESEHESEHESDYESDYDPLVDRETGRYIRCGCLHGTESRFAHAHNTKDDLDMWTTLPGEELPIEVTTLPGWAATKKVDAKVRMDTFMDVFTWQVVYEASELLLRELPVLQDGSAPSEDQIDTAGKRVLFGMDNILQHSRTFVCRGGGAYREAPSPPIFVEMVLHISPQQWDTLFGAVGTLAHVDLELMYQGVFPDWRLQL